MKTKNTFPILLTIAAGLTLFPGTRLGAQTAPVITAQPVAPGAIAGTNASLAVGVSGSGPFTYQWRLNGTNLPNGLIHTFAGNTNYGYFGDGGPATNASLWYAYNIAFDPRGVLYIADADNQRIRAVSGAGMITTVAGNGSRGFSGNNGPATSASLFYPSGVAADAAGNIYIADDENYRIRKVGANGLMNTIAGTGSPGFSGDLGAATNAALNYPQGVACDAAGNVYIADTFNNRIRKVSTNGIITTVAGNTNQGFAGNGIAATNASLYWPSGVTVDSAGNLYIADSLNEVIRKVGTNGLITTVAGDGVAGHSGDGGPALNASLTAPSAVAVDPSGNLYIADNENNLVRRVATNGVISTVAGIAATAGGSGAFGGDGGPAINASLAGPQGVAFDAAGNLYISDTYNNRIREVLLYASYPILHLISVGAASAGNYSVVITNSFGSVTSAVASLTVTLPPQIIASGADFGFVGHHFGFNISATAGQTVVVDASTNLVNWTPLFTNLVVTTPFFFSDATTNHPARYYRARLP